MATGTKREQHVWELLTRDFYWDPPAEFAVRVYGASEARSTPAKLQIFEVAVASIFASLRPDYEWYVTPNRPDGGLDFVGENHFLHDEALGIAAAIKVGGQCKKRNKVNDIVAEISGSLLRMADASNPTFFVVALSATLNPKRVEDARKILERSLQRHCHILDRHQLEGLIGDHLPVVTEILREGLSTEETEDVLDYFDAHKDGRARGSVTAIAPGRVLAGVPFSVSVGVRSSLISAPGARLWWRGPGGASTSEVITLIGPMGADLPTGVELASDRAIGDPIRAERSIELMSYSVGSVGLGEVFVGVERPGGGERGSWTALGSVQVVENVRPRFFERPFRAGLTRLDEEYQRALARGVGSVGVVGGGGSGKSRLCEEFSLEQRRRGASVVSAKQTKTLDDPHRILADLLIGLTAQSISSTDLSGGVVQQIERYDAALARRAEPAIRSILGRGERRSGTESDQALLSALLLLIIVKGRHAPLILHLQDLHWCAADVLGLLERLLWQLDVVVDAPGAPERSPQSGILFMFEGRVRERDATGLAGLGSVPFEAFLKRLDCATIACSSFDPADGLEFISRLFEGRHSAGRLVNDDLLGLQRELVERVDRAAGGNPFHSLEQVRLLKERRILGQNPNSGLLYLIQPGPDRSPMPESVFHAIQLRWEYLRAQTPELALLLWAASLVEDRLPSALFRELWREIAPEASLAAIDATEFLWTADGEAPEVAFRHENYFRSVRRFEVSGQARERVVDIYSRWFEAARRLEPGDRFRWARVLLEHPQPDVARVRSILRATLRSARRHGDSRLTRRISATSLDLTWAEDARSWIPIATFLRRSQEELDLTRDLLGSDRSQAGRRLEDLRQRLGMRLSSSRTISPRNTLELQRQNLTAEVLRSQMLFNHRRPAQAAELAEQAGRMIRALSPVIGAEDFPAWERLEMEALHSQSAALALSGEIDEAIATSERAVQIAKRSPSALSDNVISTYANILLARDPETSELILRGCLSAPTSTDSTQASEVNLSMALVLRAYRLEAKAEARAGEMIEEAHGLLKHVFNDSFQLGNYPLAGAAALMLGIVSALRNEATEVSWFAQAVAASARGGQTETLWRAHINLASSMYARQDVVDETVRDHAYAALEIIEESLSPYPQPDRSSRFELIRVPLAQAVRFMLMAGDNAGVRALERYPSLRLCFANARSGLLREDRGGYHSHEWLRMGAEDYVIY